MTDLPSPSFNLLSLFGLDKASDEEQDEFLSLASEAVLTAVVARIEEKLPADKREEFHRLFEIPAPDAEKAAFFKKYLPDFKDILIAEVERFNREALAHAKDTQ